MIARSIEWRSHPKPAPGNVRDGAWATLTATGCLDKRDAPGARAARRAGSDFRVFTSSATEVTLHHPMCSQRLAAGAARRPTRVVQAPSPTGDSGAGASHQVQRPSSPDLANPELLWSPPRPRQEGATENQIRNARSATAEFQLTRHEVFWRTRTLDPVLRGLWDWGNIAALPPQTQEQIESTTRENARVYQQHEGFVFPHSVLLGAAVKA